MRRVRLRLVVVCACRWAGGSFLLFHDSESFLFDTGTSCLFLGREISREEKALVPSEKGGCA